MQVFLNYSKHYIHIYLAIFQKLRSSSGKIWPTERGQKYLANAKARSRHGRNLFMSWKYKLCQKLTSLHLFRCNGKGETLQAEHSFESSRENILENCPNEGWRITLEPEDPQVQQSQESLSTSPHCRAHGQSPYMLVTLSVAQNHLGGCYKPVGLRAALRYSELHRWANVRPEMQTGQRWGKSAFLHFLSICHLHHHSPQVKFTSHMIWT